MGRALNAKGEKGKGNPFSIFATLPALCVRAQFSFTTTRRDGVFLSGIVCLFGFLNISRLVTTSCSCSLASSSSLILIRNFEFCIMKRGINGILISHPPTSELVCKVFLLFTFFFIRAFRKYSASAQIPPFNLHFICNFLICPLECYYTIVLSYFCPDDKHF